MGGVDVRREWLLDMLLEAVEKLAEGTPVRPVVCAHLRRAAKGDLAMYVGPSEGFAVLASDRTPSLPVDLLPDDKIADAVRTSWTNGGNVSSGRGEVSRLLEGSPAAKLRWLIWLSVSHAGTAGPVVAVGGGTAYPTGPQRDVLRAAHECLRAIEALLSRGTAVDCPGVEAATVGSLTPLSQREYQVLHLLSHGLTARAISGRLGLSPRTVHRHLDSIYRKLGAHDRLTAVNHARADGILARWT